MCGSDKVCNQMTINPYTLNSLYNQGIIECVPYDLCTVMPATQSGISEMMGMSTMPQIGNLKQEVLNSNDINVQNSQYGQNINGSEYLDEAMKGGMYEYYGNSNDSFMRTTDMDYQQGYSNSSLLSGNGGSIGNEYVRKGKTRHLNKSVKSQDNYENYYDDDGSRYREEINSAASSVKEDSVMKSHSLPKGLLSVGIVLGTIATAIALLVKGRKKP